MDVSTEQAGAAVNGGPASAAPQEEILPVVADIAAAMNSVLDGKADVVRLVLTALLAEGHLLIEDVPGVGKTLLAKTLAKVLGGSVRRVQFTPDLLPSDITGVSIFNQETRTFEFRAGAIFANVVIGDEINRASPKTQSALLEAMEEGQVTVDGRTYRLPPPFLVIATQNPLEMEGTYPLPEAQRDRFLAQISMGYPSAASELEMLERHGASSPLARTAAVTDAATVARLVEAVRGIHASPSLQAYVVALARATRESPALRLGVSPRAALHLLRASRAHAALERRAHVLPDDVQHLAGAVLAHRVILSADAALGGATPAEVIADIVRTVPVPGRS